MCRVSKQLQLCTCSKVDYSEPYRWQYYRFKEGKKDIIMGRAIMPYQLEEKLDNLNYRTLRRLLNEGNPFDFKVRPKVNDMLCLFISVKNSYLAYGFRFNGTKWRKHGYSPFRWLWYHRILRKGVIKDPFAISKM